MHHPKDAQLEPLAAATLSRTKSLIDMKKTNIMLVEDNPDYRQAVSLALADESWIENMRIFGAAEVALRALQTDPQQPAPGIILLDIGLPGLSGVEVIRDFQSLCPQAQIIMLTQSRDQADVIEAIRQGAAGYLLKSASMDQLIEGIRTVMEGGTPLEPSVARHLIDAISGQRHQVADGIELSPRELEVLRLMGEGMLKKQIADVLKISEHTVAFHVKHVYQKLDVNNSPAAIDKAHRAGIL